MRVEVLYFEGCPNHSPTVERVRAELGSRALPKEIEEIEIHNQTEAEALGFLGSPSVRINGLDIEPEARELKSFGMSCRTLFGWDSAHRFAIQQYDPPRAQ